MTRGPKLLAVFLSVGLALAQAKLTFDKADIPAKWAKLMMETKAKKATLKSHWSLDSSSSRVDPQYLPLFPGDTIVKCAQEEGPCYYPSVPGSQSVASYRCTGDTVLSRNIGSTLAAIGDIGLNPTERVWTEDLDCSCGCTAHDLQARRYEQLPCDTDAPAICEVDAEYLNIPFETVGGNVVFSIDFDAGVEQLCSTVCQLHPDCRASVFRPNSPTGRTCVGYDGFVDVIAPSGPGVVNLYFLPQDPIVPYDLSGCTVTATTLAALPTFSGYPGTFTVNSAEASPEYCVIFCLIAGQYCQTIIVEEGVQCKLYGALPTAEPTADPAGSYTLLELSC